MAIIALVAALATGTLKSGFGADTTTVTSEKTDSQGKVIERATTTSTQDAKTLWDWLNLGGVLAVPITLAILAAWLQHKQQQRDLQQTEQQAKLEREIADKNRQQDLEIAQGTREEEALQHYLDRVSNLVIEKNLLAIAAKKEPTTEEKELLDVSVDILRGLTLSTLRRLSDGVRKASAVRLLIETDIIKRLKVSLHGADLSGANLESADLRGARLRGTNLGGADLTDADLEGAYLFRADLRGAALSGANLHKAKLIGADLRAANLSDAFLRRARLMGANLKDARLRGANLAGVNLADADLFFADLDDTDLRGTHLSGANLHKAKLIGAKGLTKKQLEIAYLCNTKLPEGIDMDPNRDCGKPYGE
jgi:uncharacterized protein YjbI with pentapeptide repeats